MRPRKATSYRLRELQDRSREQALRKIAKELVRQRVEAQQLALFEEFQEEAEMGLQELEEQVAVLRQDVERTRQLLTRERDNRINIVLPKRFQIREVRVLPLSHDLPGPGCQGGLAAMSQADTAHAWWSRLRHQGLLLSPVVMVERYPSPPPAARFPLLDKLRDAYTRFVSTILPI